MPKTIKNIYDNSISFENLLKAHKKARCGKREKKKIILFELKLEQELLELEKQLKNFIGKIQIKGIIKKNII